MKRTTKPAVWLLVLLLFTPYFISAQHRANFELAERFTTEQMNKMTGSTSVSPQWIKGKNQFWYSYENPGGKNWYFVDAQKGSQRLLFDQEEMAGQLSEILAKAINAKELPLKNFKYDTDKNLFTFHVDSIRFTYNLNGNQLIKGDSLKKEEPENWASYSPDSTWIAFAKNHDLYVMRKDDPDSTEIRLTEDGERWYSYQASAGDTTSDKRLRTSARWFEDSKKLWVKRTDNRKVDELWVINSVAKDRPELETYKYAMPGDENIGIDEIRIFEPDTRKEVLLDTDKWPDQSLGGAYFNKGGIFATDKSDFLYILRRDRTWSKIDVLKANTATGETEVLFSEESKPYFNTRYMDLAIINEGKEYLWLSERTGWNQIYRYDSTGKLQNAVTSGSYVVGDIARIDTTAKTIYFNAFGREKGQNPYYSNLYSVKFDGSGFRHLTGEDANHAINASKNGNFFVDNYSRVDQPTVSVLRDASGKIQTTLQETDISEMVKQGWQAPETFSVKAADGVTDIYGVMWKPFNFDSTKTYPIISYVYPGPQTEPFPIGFTLSGAGARTASLAQVGFIVVSFGQRGGSPMRSKYYHNYGYGNMRDYPLADNKYGIEQLTARHSFIDGSKVGIYGHSGGGFMSTAALLSYPEFYTAAVSSAGNHDNNIYNIWWSEVHNGVKEQRKTVTKKDENGNETKEEQLTWDGRVDKNADLAKNLQGHLLLVHGDFDNNVHPANTFRLADALIKAGKRFDMMVLPGQRHGFGPAQPYFDRMTWYYFAQHLLGDYRPDVVDFNLPE